MGWEGKKLKKEAATPEHIPIHLKSPFCVMLLVY